MEVIALQSGSNGNCIYVETDGVRLLFDAGISGKRAQQRLAAVGRDITDVHGLIVSHDHRDHTSGIGIFQRKFGMPVYVSRPTWRTANRGARLGAVNDIRHFQPGQNLRFDHVTVETHSTPHDAVDGVCFVVDDGSRRVGILTDLGHVFDGLTDLIGSLDAVIIESNHDPRMLASGPYPQMLKRRIDGPRGHLSNEESATVLRDADCRRLQWVCLGHLSAENNEAEVAVGTHRRIVGSQLPLTVASRTAATDVLCV